MKFSTLQNNAATLLHYPEIITYDCSCATDNNLNVDMCSSSGCQFWV